MRPVCRSHCRCLVWVGLAAFALCLILIPACGGISALQESTLRGLAETPPLSDGTRNFAFTAKGKIFALLSYSVRRPPGRIAVERSYQAVMPDGTKCLATFSITYDPDSLGLISYESKIVEPLSSNLAVVLEGEKTVFSWSQQDAQGTYSAVLPACLLPLDSNYLGAEGLELAGRLIDWGSRGEQSLFMLDPSCASSSLARALLVSQASVTVVGQQEILVTSKRYLAAVADVVLPQTRFRCWYDSATLDLLRWEMVDTGFVASRVDGDDVTLVVPDKQVFTEVMASPVTVTTNLDVTRYRGAKGFKVQVDLWAVSAESDPESAMKLADQDFQGQVTRERGCWHVVGSFTTKSISNGPWPDAYATGDGSPLLSLRGDTSDEYTLAEGSIEVDDPAIRAKAVEIIGGEARLPLCTRWEAVDKITRWVCNSVKYQITQVRSARATLESLVGDCEPHSMLTVAMLRSLGVPCRLVSGMCLTGKKVGQHVWVQVFLGEKIGWVTVDPTFGEVEGLSPVRFMPWGLDGALAPAIGPVTVRVEAIR